MRLVPGFFIAIVVGAGAAAFAACGTPLAIDDPAAGDGGGRGDGGDGSAPDDKDGDITAIDGSDIIDGGGTACPADGSALTVGCAPPEVTTGVALRCEMFNSVADSGTTTRDETTFVSPPSSLLVAVDQVAKNGLVTMSFTPTAFHDATVEADIQLVSAAETVELARITISESGQATNTQAFILESDPSGTLSVAAQVSVVREQMSSVGLLCPGVFTHVRMHVQFPDALPGQALAFVTLPGKPAAKFQFATPLGAGDLKDTVFTLGASVSGGTIGKTTARFDNWSTYLY